MPTCSGREYHLGEISDTMSSNTMSSNLEKANTSLDPSLLAILEDIRGQVTNLGQRMNKIENDRRDQDRNEDPQPNQRRKDRIIRNYDQYDDDELYLKNIKFEVSKFDGRLDPQYYLDWVMSLERYFKWYEMSQKR